MSSLFQQFDDKPGKIYFQPVEFFDREGMHREAGWFFNDEEGDPYGPFLDRAHAERGLQVYLKQLERGDAPTQQTDTINLPPDEYSIE